MISCGNERALCLNNMIKNGVDMVGSMKAAMLLTIFKVENILNKGIMIAAKGIIIAVRRSVITTSLPLSW